jgi:hypothetical protein
MLSLPVSNVYPIETAGIHEVAIVLLLYICLHHIYTPTVSNVYPIETAGKFSLDGFAASAGNLREVSCYSFLT